MLKESMSIMTQMGSTIEKIRKFFSRFFDQLKLKLKPETPLFFSFSFLISFLNFLSGRPIWCKVTTPLSFERVGFPPQWVEYQRIQMYKCKNSKTLFVRITHKKIPSGCGRIFIVLTSKGEMISRFPPSLFQIMDLKRPTTHSHRASILLFLKWAKLFDQTHGSESLLNLKDHWPWKVLLLKSL